MNSIPYNLIIQSSCHWSTHCKGQFPIKALLQQLQHLMAFRCIWQITNSRCARVMLSIPLSAVHLIVDNYCAFLLSLAGHILIDSDWHFTLWLITGHFPENCGANWAFGPLLLADHAEQTLLMVPMRAIQHEDILIWICCTFLLDIFDLKLFQAYHTLLVLHLAFAEYKLQGGKESERESHLRCAGLMLFLYQIGEQLYGMEMLRGGRQLILTG